MPPIPVTKDFNIISSQFFVVLKFRWFLISNFYGRAIAEKNGVCNKQASSTCIKLAQKNTLTTIEQALANYNIL